MNNIRSKLDQARQLLKQQAYRECHAICLDVLQHQPTCGEAFCVLGLMTLEH